MLSVAFLKRCCKAKSVQSFHTCSTTVLSNIINCQVNFGLKLWSETQSERNTALERASLLKLGLLIHLGCILWFGSCALRSDAVLTWQLLYWRPLGLIALVSASWE